MSDVNLKLLAALRTIASGQLPDGDGVNTPTMMFAEQAVAAVDPALVVVKDSLTPDQPESFRVGNLITYNRDEYPDLGTWFVQLWEGESVAARVYGNDREELQRRIAALNAGVPPVVSEEEQTDHIADATEMVQGEPVAWVRFRSDGCYEGPIMNSDSRMDGVRRTSGAWTPLFTVQLVARDVLISAMDSLREAIIDVYHESVGHSSAIEKKMLKIDISAIADRYAAHPPAVAVAVPGGYAHIPPASPVPLTDGDYKTFKLGWLECEAAHRAMLAAAQKGGA